MKSIDNFTRSKNLYRHNDKIVVPKRPAEKTAKKIVDDYSKKPLVSKSKSNIEKTAVNSSKENTDKPLNVNTKTVKRPLLKFFKRINRKRKIIAIFFVLISFISIAICLTVYNFSSIMVAYSSFKSGISVAYPEYIPNNYSFENRIDAENNSAILYFKAPQNKILTIKEEKSLWDSNAVKSYVDALSNSRYSINQESGLTIFIYNNKSYWVNEGILYTVSFNNKIDNSVMRSIAVSL
jgi:hypothetical protein